ncbi:MAG: OmpH family outer membrane protein [Cardiobacteriaceae bacterium]|nr:OmpH family outer membrane protein [Cardiobacteriaceae bacterium]
MKNIFKITAAALSAAYFLVSVDLLYAEDAKRNISREKTVSVENTAEVVQVDTNKDKLSVDADVMSENQLTDLEKNMPPLFLNPEKVGNLQVGFVNFRRIMSNIPALEEIRNNLNIEFAAENQEILSLQKELEQLERAAKNSPDDEASVKKIINLERQIARKETAYRENFSLRRNEEIAKLQQMILEEVIVLAKEKGFDIILNDNAVLYVSEKADLSKMVVERFMQKQNKVKQKEDE